MQCIYDSGDQVMDRTFRAIELRNAGYGGLRDTYPTFEEKMIYIPTQKVGSMGAPAPPGQHYSHLGPNKKKCPGIFARAVDEQ
jgi:hypothetical protein